MEGRNAARQLGKAAKMKDDRKEAFEASLRQAEAERRIRNWASKQTKQYSVNALSLMTIGRGALIGALRHGG
jgi:uncharacterized damage-inducible protein DinB